MLLNHFPGLRFRQAIMESEPEPLTSPKNLLTSLRKLYGEHVDWREPAQYEAVKALLSLEQDVIVAMRTGGGKSAVAILPSTIENGITIIVTPLTSLLEDWMRRLDQLSLTYEHYTGAKGEPLTGQSNLILASADVVRFNTFMEAITILGYTRPILRMVIEEGHYWFTDYGWRDVAFADPYTMRKFNFQVVIMSATLPQAGEQFLIDQFELFNPVRIGSTSLRTELTVEIAPQVETVSAAVKRAQEIIQKISKENWMQSQDRYIIYVGSLNEGKEVASSLNLPLYHANTKAFPIEDSVRRQIYQDWIAGKPTGIVATNALAAGTDYAHVRFTIHVGKPFDAVIFEQQRGRAGRDGKRGYNFVIPIGKRWKVNPKQMHVTYGDMRGIELMQDIIYKSSQQSYPQSCYTWQLSAFFDGTGIACGDGLLHPCGECRTRKSCLCYIIINNYLHSCR